MNFFYDMRFEENLAPIQELIWTSKTQLPIHESLSPIKNLIINEKNKETFLRLFNAIPSSQNILLDSTFEFFYIDSSLVNETAWMLHCEKSPDADSIHEKILGRYRKYLANLEISLHAPHIYKITSIPGLVGYYAAPVTMRTSLPDAKALGRLWANLLFPKEEEVSNDDSPPYVKEIRALLSMNPADYLSFNAPEGTTHE